MPRIDRQPLDPEVALWAMAPGSRPVFPSNRAKPLPIIGRAIGSGHDPPMMTVLRFTSSLAAPRLHNFRGEIFFGGCVAHQMRLTRMKCRPCSISRSLTRVRFGEIRETREPQPCRYAFSVRARSLAERCFGVRAVSEVSAPLQHPCPVLARHRPKVAVLVGCVPPTNSIGRTPQKRGRTVFAPFSAVFARLGTTCAGEKYVITGC